MPDSYEVLADLRELQPRQFERFVADVWEEYQDWNTHVTQEGSDGGIDILGEPPEGGKKTAVQCKRNNRNNTIGAPKIREYAAIPKREDKVYGVTIVTTGSFTEDAKEEAKEYEDVVLFNSDKLVRLIDAADVYDRLVWYVAGEPEYWKP